MGQSTMSKGGDHTMIGLFLIGSMCEVRVVLMIASFMFCSNQMDESISIMTMRG